MDSVVTRIAPSPTGPLHVGTARTALFNVLVARKAGGKFIVRVEDTDKKRSTKEFEDNILEGLSWLGLSGDELYRQSERTTLYREALEGLLAADTAYISKEESRDEPGKEVEVIRLRNPGKTVAFTDIIRGEVSFDTGELGDFVIAKGMEEPLYHLAVVVDDEAMGITHVIRGEDHISNTPRQILIQEALGYARPAYAHLPLMLGSDKSKLSKRHGATSINEYRDMGFLPEALLNYLAFVGWTPKEDGRELMSLTELTEAFAVEDVHKAGAVFDIEKLRWYNREYLKRKPQAELLDIVKAYAPAQILSLAGYSDEKLARLLPDLLERIHVYADVTTLAEAGELSYFFETPMVSANKLAGKNTDNEGAKRHLEHVAGLLEALPENADKDAVKDVVWPYAEEQGRGAVLWPMRYALTGQERSPDPFFVTHVIGIHEAVSRLRAASATL